MSARVENGWFVEHPVGPPPFRYQETTDEQYERRAGFWRPTMRATHMLSGVRVEYIGHDVTIEYPARTRPGFPETILSHPTTAEAHAAILDIVWQAS